MHSHSPERPYDIDENPAFHPRTRVAVAALMVASIAVADRGAAQLFLLAVLLAVLRIRRPTRSGIAFVGALVSLGPYLLVLPFVADSAESVRLAGTILFRSVSLLCVARILFDSGSLPSIVLAWKLPGLPGRMQTLLLLTARYATGLSEQSATLQRAIGLRGFRPRTDRRSLRTFAAVLGQLLSRADLQGRRVERAMRMRGWVGIWPTLQTHGRSGDDRRLISAALAVLISVVLLEYLPAKVSP